MKHPKRGDLRIMKNELDTYQVEEYTYEKNSINMDWVSLGFLDTTLKAAQTRRDNRRKAQEHDKKKNTWTVVEED